MIISCNGFPPTTPPLISSSTFLSPSLSHSPVLQVNRRKKAVSGCTFKKCWCAWHQLVRCAGTIGPSYSSRSHTPSGGLLERGASPSMQHVERDVKRRRPG